MSHNFSSFQMMNEVRGKIECNAKNKMSLPFLKKKDGQIYISFFFNRGTKGQIKEGKAYGPEQWGLYDFRTKTIIETHLCKDKDFVTQRSPQEVLQYRKDTSDASSSKKDLLDAFDDIVNGLLSDGESPIIADKYKRYFADATSNIADDYLPFFYGIGTPAAINFNTKKEINTNERKVSQMNNSPSSMLQEAEFFSNCPKINAFNKALSNERTAKFMKHVLVFTGTDASYIKDAIKKESKILKRMGYIDSIESIQFKKNSDLNAKVLYTTTKESGTFTSIEEVVKRAYDAKSFIVIQASDVESIADIKGIQIYEFNGIDENGLINEIIESIPFVLSEDGRDKLIAYISAVEIESIDIPELIETIVLTHYENSDSDTVTADDIPEVPKKYLSKQSDANKKTAKDTSVRKSPVTDVETVNDVGPLNDGFRSKLDIVSSKLNPRMAKDSPAFTSGVNKNVLSMQMSSESLVLETTAASEENKAVVDATENKTEPSPQKAIKETKMQSEEPMSTTSNSSTECKEDITVLTAEIREKYLQTIYFIRKQNNSKWDKLLNAFETAVNENHYEVSGCTLYMEQSTDYSCEFYHLLYETELVTAKYKAAVAGTVRKYKKVGCYHCNHEWNYDETDIPCGTTYQITCPKCKTALNILRTQ